MRRRRRRLIREGAPLTAYSALFSIALVRSSATRSVNGSGCDARSADDELLRLLLLIEIVLQAPALEPRAAVGEHGDHIARVNAHVAFARVADERRLRLGLASFDGRRLRDRRRGNGCAR